MICGGVLGGYGVVEGAGGLWGNFWGLRGHYDVMWGLGSVGAWDACRYWGSVGSQDGQGVGFLYWGCRGLGSSGFGVPPFLVLTPPPAVAVPP